MSKLTIEDLPVSEELDSAAMAAVQGGNLPGQTIIGRTSGNFEIDDKKSGGSGKGTGTGTKASNAGSLEYVTVTLQDIVITNS